MALVEQGGSQGLGAMCYISMGALKPSFGGNAAKFKTGITTIVNRNKRSNLGKIYIYIEALTLDSETGKGYGENFASPKIIGLFIQCLLETLFLHRLFWSKNNRLSSFCIIYRNHSI